MKLVHVKKYGDEIPVQLRTDWELHLDVLAQQHGESSIILEDGRTLHDVRQPERDRIEREAAEAADAERLRIEAEELAKAPPEGGETAPETGETAPSTDEQKPEATAKPAKRAAKKATKKGGA